MAKERKSTQEKKHLEYTKDHFTFGWHSSRMFPKTWRLKKTRVNREYRRKSEQLLARTKSGIPADVRDVALKGASPPVTCTLSRDINGLRGDVELVADDFTAARFRSVVRKRLRKTGTVTVGEKVKRKLERRQDAVGRNVQRRQHYDGAATSAISTLRLLDGEKLAEVVRHADLLCGARNAEELKRVLQSSDPIDRALHFLYRIASGSAFELDALRRKPELVRELATWMERANRILNRDKRAVERKVDQKRATQKKLKTLRSR